MRYWAWLLLFGPVGCGDGVGAYRAVVRDQVHAFQEVADILSGVTDAASMRSAKEKLDERAERFEQIAARAARLAKPSRETIAEIRPEAEKLVAARDQVQTQVRRIAALPGGREFFQQFKSFRGLLPDDAP
ncbi:MAG: hypothetical protein L0215_27065 [Gemmataceae bacterium]|nr:hypothetical protein [Gemmataceae bacterium]